MGQGQLAITVLHLAAKRWFEFVDGGDPEIFDRLPLKMQIEYYYKVVGSGPLPTEGDPKRTLMFGKPLA